jgi:hypothetical protein
MASILFLITFILLIGLGCWFSFYHGAVKAYIYFSWVTPLAGIYWWNYELDLSVNEFFINTLVLISFLLSVVCLALLLIINWENMSALKFLGLIISAFFHSIPFLMYSLLTIFPPR